MVGGLIKLDTGHAADAAFWAFGFILCVIYFKLTAKVFDKTVNIMPAGESLMDSVALMGDARSLAPSEF